MNTPTTAFLRCVSILVWLAASAPHSWGAFAAQAAGTNDTSAVASSNRVEQEFQLKLEEHNLKFREFEFKKTEHWLTVFGFFGTASALVFGFYQYRKAEQWKRAEFLAKEMKDFFANCDVRNALTMIDYSPRRVNLFHDKEANVESYPVVSRTMQVLALLPHTMLSPHGGSDGVADPVGKPELDPELSSWRKKTKYSPNEARIRDSYDQFLDGLERFAANANSRLVSFKELEPYLSYWVNDIAEFTTDKDDAMWTCALMVYIEFYGFAKVQNLFIKYNFDISTSSAWFKKQSQEVEDQDLVARWCEECEKRRPKPDELNAG